MLMVITFLRLIDEIKISRWKRVYFSRICFSVLVEKPYYKTDEISQWSVKPILYLVLGSRIRLNVPSWEGLLNKVPLSFAPVVPLVENLQLLLGPLFPFDPGVEEVDPFLSALYLRTLKALFFENSWYVLPFFGVEQGD
jgi:hypothetical protein